MATSTDEFERLVQLEMERLRSQLGMKVSVGTSVPSSSSSSSLSTSGVSSSSFNSYAPNNNNNEGSSFQAAMNLDNRSSYGSSLLDTPSRNNRPTVIPPPNYSSDTVYPPLSSGSGSSSSLSVSSSSSSSGGNNNNQVTSRPPLPKGPTTTKDSLSIYQKQMSGSAMADLLPVGGVDVSPPMDGLSTSSFNQGGGGLLRSPLRPHPSYSSSGTTGPSSFSNGSIPRYPLDTENQPPGLNYPPNTKQSSSRRYSLGQSSLPLPGEGGSVGVGAQPTYRYIPPTATTTTTTTTTTSMDFVASSRNRLEHSPPPFRPDNYRTASIPSSSSSSSSTGPNVQEQLAIEKAHRAAQYAEELKQQMNEAAERKRLQKLAEEEYERGIANQVPQLPGVAGSGESISLPSSKSTKHIQFQDPPYSTDQQAPLSPLAGSLSPRSRLLTNRDGSLPPSARSPQYREVGGNMDAESVREAVLRGEKLYRFRFQTRTQEELDKLASRQRAQVEQALELERQIEERRRQKEEETRLEKQREADEERRVQKELQELARKESAEADRPPAPTEILPVHMHNNLGINGGTNAVSIAVPGGKHTSHDDRATGPTAFIKSPTKADPSTGKNSGPLPPSAARLLQIRQKVAAARDPGFYSSFATRGTAVSPPPVSQSLPIPPVVSQPSTTGTIMHEPYEQSTSNYHSRESSIEPNYDTVGGHQRSNSMDRDNNSSMYGENQRSLNNNMRRSGPPIPSGDDYGNGGGGSDSIAELARVRRNQEELTKRLEEQNTIMARMQTALRGMYNGPANPMDNFPPSSSHGMMMPGSNTFMDPRASYGSMGSFMNHLPHGGGMDSSFLPSNSHGLPPNSNGMYGVGGMFPSSNPYAPFTGMSHGFPLYNGGELPGTTSIVTASGHGNRDGAQFFMHNDPNPYVSYSSHAKAYNNGMDDSLFAAAAALDQPGVNQSYLSMAQNQVRNNNGFGRASVNSTMNNPPAPLVMKPIMGGAALPSNNIPGGPDGNDLSIRWVGKGRPMTAVPPKQTATNDTKPKDTPFPDNPNGPSPLPPRPASNQPKHESSSLQPSSTPIEGNASTDNASGYALPPQVPSSRATTRGRESSARRHRTDEYAFAVESSRKLLASQGSLNVSSDSIIPSRLNSANVMRIPGIYGSGNGPNNGDPGLKDSFDGSTVADSSTHPEGTTTGSGLGYNGRPPTGPRRREPGNTNNNPLRTSTGQSGRGTVETSLDSSTLLVYVDGLRRNANGEPSSRPFTGELSSRPNVASHPSSLTSPSHNRSTGDTSINSSLGLIVPSNHHNHHSSSGNNNTHPSSAAFHPYASPKAFPKDKHNGTFSSPASEAAAILHAGGVHSQMTNYFDALARDEAAFAEADHDGLPIAFGVPRNEEASRPRYYPPPQYVTHPAQNTHMYNNFPPPSKEDEHLSPNTHSVTHRTNHDGSSTGVTATLYMNADTDNNNVTNTSTHNDGTKINHHGIIPSNDSRVSPSAGTPHPISSQPTDRTTDEGSDAETSQRDKSQDDSPGLTYAYNAHLNMSAHTPVTLNMNSSGTSVASPGNAQQLNSYGSNPSLVSPASRSSTRTSSSPIRSVRPTSAAVRVGSARSNAPPSKATALVNFPSNNSSRPQSSTQASVTRPGNNPNDNTATVVNNNVTNGSSNGQSPYNISIAEIQAALQTDTGNAVSGNGGGMTPNSVVTNITFPVTGETNRSSLSTNTGSSTGVLTNPNTNSSPVQHHIIVEEHEGEIDAEGDENEEHEGKEGMNQRPLLDTTVHSHDMTNNIEFKDLQASFSPSTNANVSTTINMDDQTVLPPPKNLTPSVSPVERNGGEIFSHSQNPSPLTNTHSNHPDYLGNVVSTTGTDSPRLSPVDKSMLMMMGGDRLSPYPGSISRSQSRASATININNPSIPRSRRSTTTSPTNLDASVTSIGSNNSTMSITAAALADTSGKYVRRKSWGLGPEDISIHKRQLLAFYSAHAPQKATEDNIETAWEFFGPRVWEELRRKYKEKVLNFSPVPLPDIGTHTATNSRANSRPGTGHGLSPVGGSSINESKLREE